LCEVCDAATKRKFDGSFDALTQMGAKYYVSQRFKALSGNGKPLWEFKEHGLRLFCHIERTGDFVMAVLLNGWDKQKKKKKGQDKEENAQIETAHRLRQEYLDLKERTQNK
jgi:hypothetical protein